VARRCPWIARAADTSNEPRSALPAPLAAIAAALVMVASVACAGGSGAGAAPDADALATAGAYRPDANLAATAIVPGAADDADASSGSDQAGGANARDGSPEATSAGSGQLEVRFSYPIEGLPLGAPRRIELEPIWAGVNRGQARHQGWRRIELLPSVIPEAGRVALSAGTSQPVARGSLPAGTWDRVFVAVGSAVADVDRPLENHIEPIAMSLTVPAGETVCVDIALIVLERSSAPGLWRVFVRGVDLVTCQD